MYSGHNACYYLVIKCMLFPGYVSNLSPITRCLQNFYCSNQPANLIQYKQDWCRWKRRLGQVQLTDHTDQWSLCSRPPQTIRILLCQNYVTLPAVTVEALVDQWSTWHTTERHRKQEEHLLVLQSSDSFLFHNIQLFVCLCWYSDRY